MKYFGLELQPMQESGASLLRAMQNETMPKLDLLVRESVQNALDAALQKHAGGEVHIDFLVRSHATNTIAALFSDGISGDVLRNRFPTGGQLLEIRDSMTEGLTGPLSLNEVERGKSHGNLLKLVYEIGRTRTEEGAGGSWGLGKTCYFRMGVGLVIYYSRIRLDEGFQERMVACLVEDENAPDRLQTDTRTGIAWWGGGELRPLTNGSQIRDVLGQLGIRRFQGEESGTSIIIPFLREDLIPSAEREADDARDSGAVTPWWFETYESYISVALQRWFAARLDNPVFATGPWLTATVNGTAQRRGNMLPVFRVVQELYNRTVRTAAAPGDYLASSGVKEESIICRQLPTLRAAFSPPGSPGKIAAALLSATQLGMHEPDNHPDPYSCVFGMPQATPPFRPIVTFMRKPGMSVRWEDSTESRGWAGGLAGLADGRYLIAVFVPEQNRYLHDGIRSAVGTAGTTLESYLRGCERADHNKWSDVSGQSIITRIRQNCGRILKDFGSIPTPIANGAQPMRMARNFADLLLPQRGMGTDGRTGTSSPTARRASRAGGGRASADGPTFNVEEVAYIAEGMRVRWSLRWGSASSTVRRAISVEVDSETKAIGPDDWLNNGLGTFPFGLAEITVEEPVSCVEVGIGPNGTATLSATRALTAGTVLRGTLHVTYTVPSASSFCPVIKGLLGEKAGEAK